VNSYKVLNNQIFFIDSFSIVPIRYEDRMAILKWRNEQIYHLRQDKPLTELDQDNYFNNVVNKLFDQDRPNQILFSYLENDVCIGYGGLVHLNWYDKTGEISFVMDTNLEKDHFEFHWKTFLKMIEKTAFMELDLKKIYTHAYDLRPLLYSALEKQNFIKEKTYTDIDGNKVIIHSKYK
jgi:hypothetical protein